jgi:hypothetical protein
LKSQQAFVSYVKGLVIFGNTLRGDLFFGCGFAALRLRVKSSLEARSRPDGGPGYEFHGHRELFANDPAILEQFQQSFRNGLGQ